MAEVRVEGITKKYGALQVLSDINLTFPDGGFFGLLGPSGSGKTTLLRSIAGFVTPNGGSVFIDNEPVQNVPVEEREIGMVFQNYALFPNMTVADNVAFGLSVRKISGEESRTRVAEALELVRLGDLGNRKPHQLSGGQRQRVAMARAIVTNPRVLLLDEPLSALDKSLRVEMQVELKRIQREIGITTIFVTHDQEEALTLSDQIGILKGGELVRHGPPREVYDDPRDEFTAKFLGEANLFTGKLKDDQLQLDDGVVIKGATSSKIAVRPENIQISVSMPSAVNCLQADLKQTIFGGALGTSILERNGEPIKVIGRDRDMREFDGTDRVWISWSDENTISLVD